MRAWLAGALSFALLACPKPPAAPDAGAEQLTEADTEDIAGHEVKGEPAWTLRTPGTGWRLVKAERAKALRPGVARWLINPALDAHVTVTCNRAPPGLDLSTMGQLLSEQAAKKGRTLTVAGAEPLDGPWADASELRYRTAAGGAAWEHLHGFFDLVGTLCEVQGWSSAAKFGAAEADLRSIVRSFKADAPPRSRVVGETLRVLRQDPAVRARLATLTDGGVPVSLAGVALVEQGLPRLSDELIDERFALRRDLLDRLDVKVCGALVRQADDLETWLPALDKLSAAEADRWGAINRAAILARVQDAMVPPRDEAAVAAARKALLGADAEAKTALETLKSIDTTPDDKICEAERLRLHAAYKLERTPRLVLLREWLGRTW